MRYGLPYQGSKNAIAEQIVRQLPKAETLVDLFCGGCAVTHCAMLMGKYQNYIINDIEPLIVELFEGAIEGRYNNDTRWISRDDFNNLKACDPVVRYVWSFSNNGMNYCYGRCIEPWKKALHYARVFGDNSLLAEMGIDSDGSSKDIRAHHDEYAAKYRAWASGSGETNRMQGLESLQRLESLQSLQRLSGDYQAVSIPEGAVVYCDIPYRGTDCKSYNGFNHERFYEWAQDRDDVFISEYSMPEPFVEIFSIQKTVLTNANGVNGYVGEKLYTTPQAVERWGLRKEEQLTMF